MVGNTCDTASFVFLLYKIIIKAPNCAWKPSLLPVQFYEGPFFILLSRLGPSISDVLLISEEDAEHLPFMVPGLWGMQKNGLWTRPCPSGGIYQMTTRLEPFPLFLLTLPTEKVSGGPLVAQDEFDHRDVNNLQMAEKQREEKKIGPVFVRPNT